MKLPTRAAALPTTAFLALLLAGCASPPAPGEAHSHTATSGAAATDQHAMCEKHKKMMAGKSSAEQQAAMHEQMKGMSLEMRDRMQRMREQCK